LGCWRSGNKSNTLPYQGKSIMGTIVKCPQCNEVNVGSQLHCIKCQTSLIGLPREQGESPIPEFVSPPPPAENYYKKSLKPLVFKNDDKLGFLPYVFGGISFVPLCGVPFGIASIIWGLLSKKRGGKTLAIIGALGIAFTVALYSGLFYFGFVQRGGIYDSLRVQMADQNLSSLVQAIEFYKLQNDVYPPTLGELAKSQSQGRPVLTIDPTSMVGPNAQPREFYYELTKDGSGYYLLGVGVDGIQFTSDDLLPKIKAKNSGLIINPASKPAP
jgi:hypothetical protein